MTTSIFPGIKEIKGFVSLVFHLSNGDYTAGSLRDTGQLKHPGANPGQAVPLEGSSSQLWPPEPMDTAQKAEELSLVSTGLSRPAV